MRNSWTSITTRAPYVLQEDAPCIRAHNRSPDLDPTHRIVLDEPPEPFLGAMEAPVVVLQLNPGLALHLKPRERHAICTGLSSPQTVNAHPLIEQANAWWSKLVKAHVDSIPLGRIATNIQSIEYFPYRSVSFAFGHLRLASQEFGFHLARQALRRRSMIIITRGARLWYGAVPELFENPNVCVLRSVRSASLSKNNLGAKAFKRVHAALAT